MAKEKGTDTAVAVSKVNEDNVATIGNETLNVDTLLNQVANMKEGVTISSEYWTPEVGDTARVVFAGMSTMKAMNATSEDDVVPAIKLLMADGEFKGQFKKNADKVLVSTCKDLVAPKPLYLECTGKDGKAGRQYKTFVVKELN